MTAHSTRPPDGTLAGCLEHRLDGLLHKQRRRLAVARWELGQTHPRSPHRAVYLHFLKSLALRYPEAPELDEGMPTPASEGGSG